MDTETFFTPQNPIIDGIKVSVLNEEVEQLFDSYIELTRHLQELHQIFGMFCFGLESLRNAYSSKGLDLLCRNKNFKSKYSDLVVLNSLTINYISAGRSVVDSIDVCLESTYGKKSGEQKNFKDNVISKIYDNCFAYRFFYEMRNFTQHLHLLVSVADGTVCFDVNQILSTPHYNMNSKMKKFLEESNLEIMESTGDTIRYSFCIGISEFTCAVAKIYSSFLHHIEEKIHSLYKEISVIIKENPELVEDEHEIFKGHIFYEKADGMIHGFSLESDTKEMLEKYIKDADDFYKDNLAKHDMLMKAIEKMKA